MMEPAHEALRREMLEETGLSVSVGRLIWIVENFLQLRGTAFHEVGLYFEMSMETGALPDGKTFTGREGEKSLEFRWATFEELPELRLLPDFLTNGLSSLPVTTERIVWIDRAI